MDISSRNKLGSLEWHHLNDSDGLTSRILKLGRMGIQRVRLGISWADWYVGPTGEQWIARLFDKYAAAGMDILPNICFTPPSLAEHKHGGEDHSSYPPCDLKQYADFVGKIIETFGIYFDCIELWNEPNNYAYWDKGLDPKWEKFGEMVGSAAYWARNQGKKTVLGGIMSPVDLDFYDYLHAADALRHFDVVGVHAFPETWWDSSKPWAGWNPTIESIRTRLAELGYHPGIWITEAAAARNKCTPAQQLAAFKEAVAADVERVYWYSMSGDLSRTERSAVDENLGTYDESEYNCGPYPELEEYVTQHLAYLA